MQTRFPIHLIVTGFLFVASVPVICFADPPKKVSLWDRLQIDRPPIDYFSDGGDGPIARLNRKIESGEIKLAYSDEFGYLPSLLKELDIPVSSQLLAFRSLSIHAGKISGAIPRAFYFNDDIVISWFPGAHDVEVAAQDSQRGTLYFNQLDGSSRLPLFKRKPGSNLCMTCHGFGNWKSDNMETPGHINRSNQNGGFTSHATPLESRWNSYYVSGVPSSIQHMGTLLVDPKAESPRPGGANESQPEIHRYLTSTSDGVAHLIYDHQLYAHNLLSRLSNEYQLNVKSKVEERLIPYLLMHDEAPLREPIPADSTFAKEYQSRGPKDKSGRSLYDLNLKTRLFEHRISPVLNSQMVRNLPPDLKKSLFGRLNAILTGKEQLKNYAVSEADRKSTLGVLRETIPDWPQE